MKRLRSVTAALLIASQASALGADGAPAAVDGWQAYSRLRVSIFRQPDEPRQVILFEASRGEFKITVERAGAEHVVLFLIPGAILMSRNLDGEHARRPDTLEYLGLQSQFYVSLLALALPDGPRQGEDLRVRKIREDAHERLIRFPHGASVMRLAPPWQAEVVAKRRTPESIAFSLALSNPERPESKTYVTGVWEGQPIDPLLADSEPLDAWVVSYHRVAIREPNGETTYRDTLGDTRAFKTLGEVRAARSAPAAAAGR